MGNIQGKETEASDRVAVVGEGLETVAKAPLEQAKATVRETMSRGPDEGVSGGGPGTRESSRSVAALDCGPMAGRRRRPNKQRRLKKKTPKLPLVACTSIRIFQGCIITDRG
jgi:hypothetical protein